MKNPVFTGAGVAIITPMYEDGSINFDELGRILEDQIARGLHRYAVGNGVGGGQGDHAARLQAGLHGGRAFRLHADDGDVGV